MRKPAAIAALAFTPLLAACSAAPRWQPRAVPSVQVFLDTPRSSAPSLSPDGKQLAFVSDVPGIAQPYLLPVEQGPRPPARWKRLLEVRDRVHFVRFTPDGGAIVAGHDQGGDENVQLVLLSPSGGAPERLTQDPKVKTLFGTFTDDGRTLVYASNARNKGAFDLYLRPRSGAASKVAETEGHFEPVDVARGGDPVLMVEKKSSFDEALWLFDKAGGKRQITRQAARYHEARFVGDGAAIVTASDAGRDFLTLTVLSTAGEITARVDEAHDVDELAVSGDGAVAAAAYNVGGTHLVKTFDLRAPSPTKLAELTSLSGAVVRGLSLSHDGARVAVQASTATQPDQVWVADSKSGAATQQTEGDNPQLAGVKLAAPELIKVKGKGGVEVPVYLWKPPTLAPSERAPVIVWVHGGPEAQFVPSWSPVLQHFVAKGYVVAAPNVRGSTGYGLAYTHLDDVEKREDSVADLAEVNRHLRTLPFVDEGRIAVLGGSYGGYMVLASLTLYPELWAAGCDIVGIASFRTFLEKTAPYRRAQREAEYGSLARHGELLDRLSPLGKVDRIRAPLFVIHGANDPRVPVFEAEQIVSAVKARGVEVAYLRFENEGHGLARRENQVKAYTELGAFFDRVLSPR